MNTKSFVSGLDPENTVKGYYDENDQLVLVEPEGSGGGDGDYTKATLTVNGSTTMALPVIYDGDLIVDYSTFNGVVDILVPCIIELSEISSVEGNITEAEGEEEGWYKITGDAVINVGIK